MSIKERYQLREGISAFNSDILRFGDVDKDGYEDMMVTLEDKDSRKKHAFLFKSDECGEEMIKQFGIKDTQWGGCRYFNLEPFEQYFKELNEADSFMTTYFDFGEYG